MPWNDCKPMDERLKFIARLLEGEKLAPLCREFGISRVTGYKIFNRYKECGLDGLYNRSRAPYRQANKLPFQVERTILGIKKEHPSWGAPKNRAKLIRQYPMIPAAGRDRPLSSGYSSGHYVRSDEALDDSCQGVAATSYVKFSPQFDTMTGGNPAHCGNGEIRARTSENQPRTITGRCRICPVLPPWINRSTGF